LFFDLPENRDMRLEHYPVDKLKQEVRDILGRHLDLSQYRVFFFGSRVTGKGTDRSDIDIGIEGKEPVPAETMDAIQEDIENLPTLYKIEIVDFKRVTEKFYQVATQQREFINAEI
jgi:predicted nucleotidyltransferase